MAELDMKQTGMLVAILAVGIGTWYAWTHEGKTHNLTPMDVAFADNSYSPYAWWVSHGHQGAVTYHYPETTMQNCHPEVIANSEGTLSVAMSEVGNG